jgi:TM2 domain-containing membrane protein YozV
MQSMPIQPPIFFKNPTTATILSFFITGLGQLYNGQIGKGILYFVAAVVSSISMAVGIGFILLPIVWILGMVDANTSAKRINQRLAAGASPFQTG